MNGVSRITLKRSKAPKIWAVNQNNSGISTVYQSYMKSTLKVIQIIVMKIENCVYASNNLCSCSAFMRTSPFRHSGE